MGQAERRPDATALVMGGDRLTYGQLDTLSNQLARTLKAAGCERGDRVCFLLPKSPLAIVSMLGILKADCIYIPVDPSSPAPRVAKIVQSGGPRVILAGSSAAPLLDELLSHEQLGGTTAIGGLDQGRGPAVGEHVAPRFSLEDVRRAAISPLAFRNEARDPAHILFTSGSTGTPKGVVITHGSVIRFVEWATGYFGLGPADRMSGHPDRKSTRLNSSH